MSLSNRVIAVSLALVSIAAAITAPAVAATLKRMQLPEIVTGADRIVHARAVDQHVYWDRTGRRIHTDTRFEIIDGIKGSGPARITVTMPGGRIDPVETRAEGTPVFKVGEEVLLFTSARPDGMKNLVGFGQGVLRVRKDPVTGGRFVVLGESRGLDIAGKETGRASVTRPAQRAVPLGIMIEELRNLVKGGTVAVPIEMTPRQVEAANP